MPPSSDVLEEVRAWFRRAEGDLRNIEIVLPVEDGPLETVCFHAQQAAEKYLKGYLTYLGAPFPRVHDLEELLDGLPDGAKLAVEVDVVTELTQLAVGPRYPGWDDPIDRSLAERAHAAALAVKTEVLASLATRGFRP